MSIRRGVFVLLTAILAGLIVLGLPFNAAAAKGAGGGKNRKAAASQQRNMKQGQRKAGMGKAPGNAQRKAAASPVRKSPRATMKPGTGVVKDVVTTSASRSMAPSADSLTTKSSALGLNTTTASAPASVLAPANKSSAQEKGPTGFRLSGLGMGVALPAMGNPAPDFRLTKLDGTQISSNDLRGQTVILQFGSLSSPIYRSTVSAMNALSADAPANTIFLVAYTQEAHPVGSPSPYADGEWVPVKDREEGILIAQTTTVEQRMDTARRAVSSLSDKRIVAVDDVSNAVWKAYGGRANSVFIISPEGKIVMASEYPDLAATAAYLKKEKLRVAGQ